MTAKKTHWKELADPRYIGAYALPNGADMVVTIDYARREEITVEGGRKEFHTLVYLKGHKPLILNVTNGRTIQQLHGAYIEDWAGKQITLYASTTRFENDLVECLRIRPTVPVANKKKISGERLAHALAQVRTGSYPLAKLRDGFALTAPQQAQVDELERSLADA